MRACSRPLSHSRTTSLCACTSASKYAQASMRVHPCGCVCIRACPQTSDATYPTASSEPSTTRCKTWMQFPLSASHTRSVPSMLPVYTYPRLYCKHVMRASWRSVEASHSSTIHDALMSAPASAACACEPPPCCLRPRLASWLVPAAALALREPAPPAPPPRRAPPRLGPSGPFGGPPPRRASTPKCPGWAGGQHLDGPCHTEHGVRRGWERRPAAWTVTHPHALTQPSRRRPGHAQPQRPEGRNWVSFTSNASIAWSGVQRPTNKKNKTRQKSLADTSAKFENDAGRRLPLCDGSVHVTQVVPAR
jgi:hypothetical protein